MAAFQEWLCSFKAALPPDQNVNEALGRSLPFHIFIYWLAGMRRFDRVVPVEGGGSALLLPNVRFRCSPADLKPSGVRSGCHMPDGGWSNMPRELHNWQPFIGGDCLSRSTFALLERHGAARWAEG